MPQRAGDPQVPCAAINGGAAAGSHGVMSLHCCCTALPTSQPPPTRAQERRHLPGSPTNKVVASTLLSGQERME